MKKFVKFISLTLVAMSLLAFSIPAMAAELSVADGKSAKYLFDISNCTSAPTFSVRPINTAANHTAQVKLNYNDLTVSSTYFKYSNAIGLSGSMTEKTLRQNANNFAFVSGRSDRAQIQLVSTNGAFAIRFYKN